MCDGWNRREFNLFSLCDVFYWCWNGGDLKNCFLVEWKQIVTFRDAGSPLGFSIFGSYLKVNLLVKNRVQFTSADDFVGETRNTKKHATLLKNLKYLHMCNVTR